MKLPRVSIRALMAVVLVVALDCMIVRSVGSRPAFLTSGLTFLLLGSLPMVHLLALGAARLARGPIRSRPLLIGFLVCGLIALAATTFWHNSILYGLGSGIESIPGAEAWMDSLPELAQVHIASSIVAAAFLLMQLAAVGASVLMVRRMARVCGETSSVDRTPWHRLAPPLIAVVIVAIPALAVEGYLRWAVDPKIARRAVGSEAIIDLKRKPRSPSAPPKGSPMLLLAGIRVRVDRDIEPCLIEMFSYSRDGTFVEQVRDLRNVRVTLLEGDRAGEASSIPHCYLRPLPSTGSNRETRAADPGRIKPVPE